MGLLLPALLALLGCDSEPLAIIAQDPGEVVTPLPPLPGDCLCWCDFQPRCPWLHKIVLLQESQGGGDTFEVAFDVQDYRMMGWYAGRLPYEPVDYLAFRFTYDPAALELLGSYLGADTDLPSWHEVVVVREWSEDPTRNVVMFTASPWDDAEALTYPSLFESVAVPGYEPARYHIFRVARFVFRQKAQRGETAIIPELRLAFPWPSYNGVPDPLYLRLTPTGPRRQTGVAS